ncbi:MAG: hypothetical protein ACXWQO_09840 [Bdellovibrionota bacterium]
MRKTAESPHYISTFLFLALLSIAAKVFLASLGHNYDVESFEIVQSLFRDGKNVYANTIRYNYGPIWFLILSGLGYLSDHFPFTAARENFHLWVALFLSLVDIGCACMLQKMGHKKAALLFLLSPISLLITGFHSQFDQLPIFFALPAIYLLNRDEKMTWESALLVSFWLGISLVTKHCLLFFPAWVVFWIFAREPRNYRGMGIVASIPFVIFLVSFLPFAITPEARAGISANVFHYSSDNLYALVPKIFGLVGLNSLLEAVFGWVPIFSGYKFFWLLGMLGLGWVFRRRPAIELLFLYTITLIVLTPALSDQYLAIPALACAFFWRSPWIKGFVLLSAVFLVFFSPANLATIPAMAGVRDALAALPVRRYFAVAFLAVFLVQELRRNRANILSPSQT